MHRIPSAGQHAPCRIARLYPYGANMGMNRTFSVFLLLLLALAGCSDEPEGAEYFSANGAKRLVYDIKVLVPFTGEVKAVAVKTNHGTVQIEGCSYYKIVTVYDGLPGAESETAYMRLAVDGIYSRKSTDPGASEQLELPLPPIIGRKWVSVGDDGDFQNEILAIEDLLTIDRTYRRCVKVVSSGTKDGFPMEITAYYAPNLGLVQQTEQAAGITAELKLRRN